MTSRLVDHILLYAIISSQVVFGEAIASPFDFFVNSERGLKSCSSTGSSGTRGATVVVSDLSSRKVETRTIYALPYALKCIHETEDAPYKP